MTPGLRRTAEEILELALDHLTMACSHAATDADPAVVTDAIALRLAAAVDALTPLDPDLRDRIAGGAWEQMRGMRNRIVHGYASVSARVVKATVDTEVEPLMRRIDDVLREFSSDR